MEERSRTQCEDKLFKVLVVGDPGVGKSSVVLRYVKKRFSEEYKATVGVDFALQTIKWDDRTMVRLQLWDIAGQERFKNMSRVYFKGAMGALVVFDITDGSTLDAALEWKQDLDIKVCLESGGPIPAILLANKCDVKGGHREQESTLDKICKDNKFLGWFKTSAKDNINIDEASALLVKQMLLCDAGLSGEEQRDVIDVSETQGQSSCCMAQRINKEDAPNHQ